MYIIAHTCISVITKNSLVFVLWNNAMFSLKYATKCGLAGFNIKVALVSVTFSGRTGIDCQNSTSSEEK